MKNLLWVLLSIVATLLFVACDDDGASAGNGSDKESVASRVDTLYVFSKDTVYSVDTTHFVDTLIVRDTTHYVDTIVVKGENDTILILGATDTIVVLDTSLFKDTMELIEFIQRHDDSCYVSGYGANAALICGMYGYPLTEYYCAGRLYEPNYEVCFKDKVVPLKNMASCGYDRYDSTAYFCSGGTIYQKCNGETYSPIIETCVRVNDFERIRPLCGLLQAYNQYTQFCDEDALKVYDLCGGNTYKPTEEFCGTDNQVHRLCNGKTYDVDIKHCEDGVIVENQ